MRLGLILGDQLSADLPTLAALDKGRDRLVMAEVMAEATYVPHHQQKLVLLFSAMRHFAARLEEDGWRIAYYALDDHDCHSLLDVLRAELVEEDFSQLVVTHCGEHRLQSDIDECWGDLLQRPVECLEDSRFLCSRQAFADWAEGRKQLRMEYFYRQMRRQTGYLMAGDKPEGDAWNLDASNRKPWKGEPPPPAPPVFERDEIDRAVMALVAERFGDRMGSLEAFAWATTRADARRALAHFVERALPHFGDFQDALARGEDHLFHSLLSPYINAGLLDPREVCEAALAAYDSGEAPLNAVEGFIRQIIGWREYVRGIYWLHMPAYKALNRLDNRRPLPAMYWHGDTAMACMRECLRNTIDHGYAHHIQRLMVTGNFALLAGVMPGEICDWYLSVYVDAYEWVELPNTLGMVMHADAGYLGSKPYAASGSYIHRMSDYCRHCHYNVKTRDQHDSCPFNSLYWHFIHRHREQFDGNPRMGMIYKNLDKMEAGTREAILARGDDLLGRLDEL